MGGQLVIEAVRATAMERMGLQTRIVLAVMAAHAFDKPRGDIPARVYWGGLRTLGTEIYGPHEWGPNSYERLAIKRAIRQLTKRGLIRVYADQPGAATAYEILPRGGDTHDPHRGGSP